VASAAGVTWVNDSKATNPGAAERAIEGIQGPILWIAGGRGKGLSYASLAEIAAKRVKLALLIGEAADDLERALAGKVTCRRCAVLEDAVSAAASSSEPGDVVLLAPACASFDQFESFEHRGECFREAVLRRVEENGP
jgi:UDP-N-acetylmuramoylalanine--D-glutamate ligase